MKSLIKKDDNYCKLFFIPNSYHVPYIIMYFVLISPLPLLILIFLFRPFTFFLILVLIQFEVKTIDLIFFIEFVLFKIFFTLVFSFSNFYYYLTGVTREDLVVADIKFRDKYDEYFYFFGVNWNNIFDFMTTFWVGGWFSLSFF